MRPHIRYLILRLTPFRRITLVKILVDFSIQARATDPEIPSTGPLTMRCCTSGAARFSRMKIIDGRGSVQEWDRRYLEVNTPLRQRSVCWARGSRFVQPWRMGSD